MELKFVTLGRIRYLRNFFAAVLLVACDAPCDKKVVRFFGTWCQKGMLKMQERIHSR